MKKINKIDMNKVTYSSIKARVLSETPIFWRKIRFICISLGTIGATIKASVELNSIQFDWLLPKYYNLAIIIGALGTGFASLTSNNNENK
jgi:hypothetical protein